jgi:hypothetical protein
MIDKSRMGKNLEKISLCSIRGADLELDEETEEYNEKPQSGYQIILLKF